MSRGIKPFRRKSFIPGGLFKTVEIMYRRIDEFLDSEASVKKGEAPRKRKKRLKETSLDSFLPEEHVEYFRQLRIGSKKMRNAKIEGL